MGPKINIVIITIIKEFIFAPGISVRKFSTIKSPPKPRKTSEKRDAPISIKNTIAFILRVSIHEFFKISKLIFFLQKRLLLPPTHPTKQIQSGLQFQRELNPK